MPEHPSLITARDIQSLRLILQPWRDERQKIALVPTMGALHEGHLSLIRLAKAHADRVVVSIFVNPRQFAPGEDYAAYPRQEAEDTQKAANAGADIVYIPHAGEMYPDNYQTTISVPALAEPLDGASRLGFFDGIATVVTKLFNQVQPDAAIFGEKDFQQLLIIRQLVRDLNLSIDIVGAPIVREPDGLAMSSRNQYLSSVERKTASDLNRIMSDVLERIRAGGDVASEIADGRDCLVKAGLAPIDYFELRRLPDLSLVENGILGDADRKNARLFAAIILGRTRLIDNMAL
ncbi:MAG: pantoate--beta-alanine ligase [Pseudomonadota bacterium]